MLVGGNACCTVRWSDVRCNVDVPCGNVRCEVRRGDGFGSDDVRCDGFGGILLY